MDIPDPASIADVHMFSPETSSCLDYSADFSHLQVRAQIDCGAAVTTTNRATMIHQYRPINFRKYLRDAGGHLHQVVGEGYLKIRASAKENGPEDHVLIHCWYTPTLECTLLSPGELCNRQRKYYKAYEIGTNIDNGAGYVRLCTRASGINPDLYIKSKAEGNLTYSYPLIAPGEADQIEDVHSLSSIATRELWHQRLCHLHKRAVADLSHRVAVVRVGDNLLGGADREHDGWNEHLLGEHDADGRAGPRQRNRGVLRCPWPALTSCDFTLI